MAEEFYPRDFARQNCLASFYSEIAMESYVNAHILYNEIKKDDYRGENLYKLCKMQKQVISTVVFSAMCIESFLNDYAASCLGDDEFYDNFDKLSAISKFQLIAQFILKTEIDKSKSYYFRLKELFRNRDSYVHNKSSDAEIYGYSEDEYEMFNAFREEFEAGLIDSNLSKTETDNDFRQALNALKAVYELATFFDFRDSNIKAVIRLFGPHCIDYDEEPEQKVKKIVFEDLGIKAKAYK